MNSYKYEMTGAMLATGLLVFIVVAASNSLVAAFAAAIGFMAAYLAGARFSVFCYTALRRWVHRGATHPDGAPDFSMMVILWPVALPLAIVVYGALGIVNRVMPDART